MRLLTGVLLAVFAALGALHPVAHAQFDGGNIRVGDVLYIEVYQAPEMSQTYLVSQDNTVTMPYVGVVRVGGMTEAGATSAISTALSKVLYRPRVTVTRSDVGLTSRASGRREAMKLEMITLNNSDAENVSGLLRGMSSEGGSISFDADTNTLFITDTPIAIREIMNVVGRLDRLQSQMSQVLIETTIAEVRVGALKEMGIRWFVQSDKFAGGFNPSPITTTGINALTGNFGPLDNEIVSDSDNSIFGATNGREFVGQDFDRRLALPVLVPLPGQAFMGFSSGSLDVGSIIDALASDRKAELLSEPRILTVNHKKATIKVVDEFPFTEFGTELTGATRFSTDFLEFGIVLEVTPHVLHDEIADYVKLELKPEVSFPVGIKNGVPIRSVRSSETVAKVRDGQTLIVGGIITEDRQNVVTKLPGIGDLPLIGKLFKHKEDTKFRKELMIFVTPTIYNRPEEITWDKMIDVAQELQKSSMIPEQEIRKESRKD